MREIPIHGMFDHLGPKRKIETPQSAACKAIASLLVAGADFFVADIAEDPERYLGHDGTQTLDVIAEDVDEDLNFQPW